MSLEHHEPDAVDTIARMLGYEDIDQAFEAQRSKDRQRLLDPGAGPVVPFTPLQSLCGKLES